MSDKYLGNNVNKVCCYVIFIGPDNAQYTSKPSRGLYTVSQNLVQSKGVLSSEIASDRCSFMFNVNAQVTMGWHIEMNKK